ncbi:hypothetical protein MSG_00271 [Mycobacterium shigaense]|uniref:Uncharacterized protein n=1 Tax=Mycobacterium shigaense TaxID=722731 RepID=A0A1Z4EBV2_9MYCO|nr:hypothetical protein B2J96_02375 [Mycobacterium shigaense]BAX90437.1 hypothetical protein MSG_00271 [Mycobacterium shigaense]
MYRTVIKGMAAAAVALGSVGLALGVTAAAHAALSPAPESPSPFATDNFTVPHNWCPGQPLPMPDVRWDMNVCHHWYWVAVGGTGNVGQFVWEGAAPRRPLGPPPCYGAPICLPGH